ncbi:MAG: IS5 family transposase [Deltaproteobacteria bacterium]|nr:IS5 family transposase [Deltaproteobacteria bacterium]
MKPKKSPHKDRQQDLFRSGLVRIIDPNHGLVKLAKVVDWDRLDEQFGSTYCPDNGRPGVSTRLMVALHYLKYTYNLSDEDVVEAWVENPYWQYFSGMKYFEHRFPIDPSSMTRWRKRIGQAGAEELLKETIASGLKLKAIKAHQLKRVNVDTTVQEKHVRFPTDARLYDRARQRLVDHAKERGIQLRQNYNRKRQNYNRKSKQMLIGQSRYSHARQMKRARKCPRKLRTYLGRVIRDIERKCPRPDDQLQSLLKIAKRIYQQQQHDKNKIYSVYEPHVECISKGKAHKRYEFGCKVSVAATSRGGWFVGAMAVHNNPYDGHTLKDTLEQVHRIVCLPAHVFVDMGYRGHGYSGEVEIHVDKRRRGRTAKSLWRWMKRRAAIEPGIGHLKSEHRMDRNRLRGVEGDRFNAILSAAGMNFRKLLGAAADILHLIFSWLLSCQRTMSMKVSMI